MSFMPQVPITGIAGWRFLERTQASQQAAFEKGPELQRDIAYFEERIGTITSAADLVADRRLLKVALGAFGMESEIDKRAFLRKVLDEGTTDPKAFANRLTDPAYRKFAETFGFGNAGGARTNEAGFAARIVAAYKTRAFEAAVGQSDNNMRLAMNFRREMAELSAGEGASWFTVLGSQPLREVFEKAFGLPRQFGQIDVDRQHDIMRDKAAALFGSGGSLAAFQDPAAVERVLNRFLARAQMEGGIAPTTRGSAALSLLQASQDADASQGLFNLLASRG